MRITSGMLRAEGLAALQRNVRGLRDAQAQVVDGRRIRRASDDPAVATTLLATDGRLRALEQYRRNIVSARTQLQSEESVLEQVTDVLSRARELATAEGGGLANGQTRALAQREVDELLATVVQLANTRHGTSYLFGGEHAETRPFDANGAADPLRPPVNARSFEIAEGQIAHASHDGWDVFAGSQVIESLRALSGALANDSAVEIAQAHNEVSAAFDNVQTLLGEVGARTIRLEMAEANIDALGHSLRTMSSDIGDVDLEAAVSTLVARQSTFEAALLATSRVLQTTLTQYLR